MCEVEDLTSKVVDRYWKICSTLDTLAESDCGSDKAEPAAIASTVLALTVELASFLNVENEEYMTEITTRIRVIEREVSALLNRSRALFHSHFHFL